MPLLASWSMLVGSTKCIFGTVWNKMDDWLTHNVQALSCGVSQTPAPVSSLEVTEGHIICPPSIFSHKPTEILQSWNTRQVTLSQYITGIVTWSPPGCYYVSYRCSHWASFFFFKPDFSQTLQFGLHVVKERRRGIAGERQWQASASLFLSRSTVAFPSQWFGLEAVQAVLRQRLQQQKETAAMVFIPAPMCLHKLGGIEQGWGSQQMLNEAWSE